MRSLLILLLCTGLAACAGTGPALDYHPFDGRSGFVDVELAPEHHLVQVFGPLSADSSTLELHLVRRAEELCGDAFATSDVRSRFRGGRGIELPVELEREGLDPVEHRDGTRMRWVEAEVSCSQPPR